MEIKRIGLWSSAKIIGFMYLIFGIIYGLITVPIIILIGLSEGFTIMTWLMLVGSVIGIPLSAWILGLVSGIISAVLYNISAHYLGGLEIKTNLDSSTSKSSHLSDEQYHKTHEHTGQSHEQNNYHNNDYHSDHY